MDCMQAMELGVGFCIYILEIILDLCNVLSTVHKLRTVCSVQSDWSGCIQRGTQLGPGSQSEGPTFQMTLLLL